MLNRRLSYPTNMAGLDICRVKKYDIKAALLHLRRMR
jgi:hypothetical protein